MVVEEDIVRVEESNKQENPYAEMTWIEPFTQDRHISTNDTDMLDNLLISSDRAVKADRAQESRNIKAWRMFITHKRVHFKDEIG